VDKDSWTVPRVLTVRRNNHRVLSRAEVAADNKQDERAPRRMGSCFEAGVDPQVKQEAMRWWREGFKMQTYPHVIHIFQDVVLWKSWDARVVTGRPFLVNQALWPI
jgi:hypothetical protein